MDVEEFPWLWVPGALLLVSLILYGVDAAWMTPLYVAEMLMFILLGAELSDYSKGKPSVAFGSVALWVAGQLLLWMGLSRLLLWLVVVLQLGLGYIYFYTRMGRLTARKMREGYVDYDVLSLLLLVFFSIGRIALAGSLQEAFWALGILLIAGCLLFLEGVIPGMGLGAYRRYRWVRYLAPIGALLSSYAALAVAAPGLPLAII
jgi:hypothetical protein